MKFSQEERIILEEICNIQISSLQNIIEGKIEVEEIEVLRSYQSNKEELNKEAKWRISQYREVIKQPLYLGILPNYDLSILRHILFHMEEFYMDKYDAVQSLWSKFFEIEKRRNPEINITLKLVDHEQSERTKPKFLLCNKY